MSKDHQTGIDKAMNLAQKLDDTPEDNNITRKLLDMEKHYKEKVNGLSDGEFDKAYINNEVTYHKMDIDIVENKLMLDFQNKKFEVLLESVLPLFKGHLNLAAELKNALEE